MIEQEKVMASLPIYKGERNSYSLSLAAGSLRFGWSQQSFLRHDREFTEDRLYVDEKKAFLGVRTPFAARLSAELQGGFAFALG